MTLLLLYLLGFCRKKEAAAGGQFYDMKMFFAEP